ncbi:XRE family transcriptional regulator, master regulator for biofilm formation [Alteribacillus persepolensis]|uniref:XRE family transcriptional regulator, master regulator for biofilm formation n=1 Tax=Alteribacillus persepolensis TaxID=568899 RepID=A0A1G8EXG5_9BACI|nr:DNA-binding anti-repressor SinI [Alteribacillus persepolensis]SDH74603.1 XRE family transcriptional regulator, master regulator for biofilm formation [Alteribacillus persepolensis]
MIGQRIMHYRYVRDMSLQELANKAEMSLLYLQRVEQNIYPYLSVQYVERVAEVLQIPVENLINTPSHDTLESEWMDVVIEAMESGISKESFRQFIQENKEKNNEI